MRKIFLTALVFLGLAVNTTKAQNYCTDQEDCKPKTCCVETLDCCDDDKVDMKNEEIKNETNTTSKKRKKIATRKKEVVMVQNKNE